jgi:predicted AlkP superfamily phosphohydrolase/phosphomutase
MAVEKLYDFSDNLVGETLNLVEDPTNLETVVIIVSDHGWDDSTRAHDMAPHGIFLMSGGPTLASGERTHLHIYDVAPTILALLGLPVPRDMDGRVATELVDPTFWDEYPIQYITTYASGALSQPQEMEIELDQDDLDELKALGYIE